MRPRLDVLVIDPGVADMGIGQGDDLPRIGWIGENFLIAGQRGIEDHLTDGHAFGADGTATKYRAVS
jgi:hypothetical protein